MFPHYLSRCIGAPHLSLPAVCYELLDRRVYSGKFIQYQKFELQEYVFSFCKRNFSSIPNIKFEISWFTIVVVNNKSQTIAFLKLQQLGTCTKTAALDNKQFVYFHIHQVQR